MIRDNITEEKQPFGLDRTAVHETGTTTSDIRLCWYATHVRSRHEKLVTSELTTKGISHFLPLLEKRKTWSDRTMTIQEPLFPGYVFVNIDQSERVAVLETRGVVQLVGNPGKPWPIPEDEISAIRTVLEKKLSYDPYPYLKVGSPVQVNRGPLKGFQGILAEKNKKHRLILSVHLIGQSISVEIDARDVDPV